MSAPVTPSVCPRCGSPDPGKPWRQVGFGKTDPCQHPWHKATATPPPSGSPTPHDLTLENILYVADYSPDACGCEHRGDRWFMCAYHEGYDDALEAQAARITELEAAVADHTLTTPTEETE